MSPELKELPATAGPALPPRDSHGRTPRAVALALLAKGFHPVALYSAAEEPNGKGKRPIGSAWGDHRQTLNADGLGRKFDDHPDAGVGICLGPGRTRWGRWLIDVEVDGPEGEDSFLRLVGGEIVETMGWTSARGRHRLFLVVDDFLGLLQAAGAVEGKGSQKGVFHLPDFRGLEIRVGGEKEGGSLKQLQSACPPTVGTDGKPREWTGGWDVAELPDAALAALEAVAERAAVRAESGSPPAPAVESQPSEGWAIPVTTPGDPAGRKERYARNGFEAELARVAAAVEGERNTTLNRASFAIGQLVGAGAVSGAEATAGLTQAALSIGLGEEEARNTIRSGLEAGMGRPRDLSNVGVQAPMMSSAAPNGPGGEGDDEWPPLKIGMAPDVEPFPLELLPHPARRLVEVAAESIGCPVDFVAAGVLGAASAAIGRSAELEVKPGYRESAALFIAAVGGPSSGKSPAISIAMKPIRDLEIQARAEWEEEHRAWKQTKEEDRGEEPALRRIYTTDPTTEALGPILQANPRGMAITPDELTKFILGMDQYKGGKGGDRPFYLSAWSGHPVQVDRAKNALKPIFVPHPFLTVAGGLTPDMGSSLVEGKGRDDGFIARFLFCFPEPIPRPYSRRGVHPEVAEDWRRLVNGLWARPMLETDAGPRPNVVRMTPAAADAWFGACNAHRAEMYAIDFPRSLEGCWGKLEQYAARLALVLHLMHDSAPLRGIIQQPPDVQPATIEAAWRLVGYFKSHALRFHAQGRATVIPDIAMAILEWVMKHEIERFTERDIRRSSTRFENNIAGVAEAIRWMRDHGAIRAASPPSVSPRAGRPQAPAWDVHPVILKGGIAR
ncbi:DUF3987 domain-containing protein [Paludisphaera rhizosphaerae]|uniref:DUF3987 domain-containing protein n=1 Tax=Paludisphaera rhizosphaerae TaxID=2711216 RepID=UPI0013E9E97C|nr:DUF3987 domain-containing protein [Paludisphaera rhizosphaerae]